MEETYNTNAKLLSTNHCEFYGTRSYGHTQKAISLALIHSFTKQVIPSLYQELLLEIIDV